MERLYLLVVNRPKTLLILLFLLTGVFGWYAKDIRLDSSVESLLSQDNPDSQYYAEVRQLFGSDEVGVVGLLAADIYTAEVLRMIRRLTEALEKIEGVQEVLSLTNAVDPIADVVEPPLLVKQIPTDQASLDTLRDTLADRPIYMKNLVSEDGKAAAINIFFAAMNDDEFRQRGIDDQIQAPHRERTRDGTGTAVLYRTPPLQSLFRARHAERYNALRPTDPLGYCGCALL